MLKSFNSHLLRFLKTLGHTIRIIKTKIIFLGENPCISYRFYKNQKQVAIIFIFWRP